MEISVEDFLNTLVGYFDPIEGMAARDRLLDGVLRDESTWPFMTDDFPTLAALLSGVVGVSRLLEEARLDEFVSLMAAGLPDEFTLATEQALLGTLFVRSDERLETIKRLLNIMSEWQKIVLAVYLQMARYHQARQGAMVSYDLYKPGSRR